MHATCMKQITYLVCGVKQLLKKLAVQNAICGEKLILTTSGFKTVSVLRTFSNSELYESKFFL